MLISGEDERVQMQSKPKYSGGPNPSFYQTMVPSPWWPESIPDAESLGWLA